MKQPRCRLCGVEHPLGGAHKFDGRVGSATREPSREPAKAETLVRQSAVGSLPSRILETAGGARPPKFDRTAYQWELMRKRRAAQKAARES